MARPPSAPALATVVALALCLLVPSLATADEPAADDAPRTEEHWYGAPILVADVAVFGLVYAGSQTGDDSVRLAGYVVGNGLLFDGMVGHLMHHHGARAAESVALRLGLPLLGMALARSTCEGGPTESCDDSGWSGAALGLFTAIALDDLLLAVEDRPAPDAGAPGLQLGLAPRGDGGFVASLGATF